VGVVLMTHFTWCVDILIYMDLNSNMVNWCRKDSFYRAAICL